LPAWQKVFLRPGSAYNSSPDLVQALSSHALQTIKVGEGSLLCILCATVSDIVAITIQIETVTSQLAKIWNENQDLFSNLHDLFSRVAN